MTEEPSYRSVSWETSYERSAEAVPWQPPRERNEAELAIEWRIRRIADLMDSASEAMECFKVFGEPPLRVFWRLEDDGSVTVWWVEEDPNPDGDDVC